MCIFGLGLSSTICNTFSCLSIRLFCYDPFVHILCSKIILPPLRPVSGLSSLFLPLNGDRNIFRFGFFFFCFFFGRSGFVCIVQYCLGISLVFLLSPLPSDLFLQVVSCSCIAFSSLSQHLLFFVCIIIILLMSLKDSSQYSGRSHQYCLDSSSDFQLFQSLFQAVGDYSKCANYN